MGKVSEEYLDSFSSLERRFLALYRRISQALFNPVVRPLSHLGVSPDALSLLQVVLGVGIFLTIVDNPRLSFVLFIAALLLDGLDGALARSIGRYSRFGILLDQSCDYTRETLMVAALTWAGALAPHLAVLYIFVYAVFNLTLFLCNYFGISQTLALKSYLVFYPAIFSYLWLGINWLDAAVLLSMSLMVLVLISGFWSLRDSLA